MKTHSECLVLIVDSDREWCSRISGGLMVLEYKTAITFNSHQAIEMIEQLRPHVVVCDIDLSEGSATAVLDFGSRQARPVPVIVSASRSSYESPDIARALKRGAFDCLIKPYTPEILSRKIEQAIRVTSPLSVHDLLHDFSSFFNQMSRLNSSQDLEKLIDISFVYFLKISEAQSAALYFYNKDQRSWRKMRENISDGSSPPDDLPSAFINRVAAARRAFIDADIGSANDSGPPDNGTFLVIPLFAGNDLRGIVTLRRSSSQTPFSSANVHAAEIVAAQVGNALVNATLYETVNQKLLELQIISSYSEKLMGMVDKYDVIHCLAETTIRHFEMDFIGFLVIQRRIHEFLYWSRYSVDDKTLQEFGVETMTAYNRAAETNLRRRRFVTAAIKLDGYPNDPLRLPPLGFRSVLPLCWEDLRFGAVFIGSVDEPERASGKLALLSSIVGQTRIALTNTKLYGDMKENYIRTIKALAIAVDAKDTYTHGHSENVMNIAEEIARELSIEEKSIGSIRDAGLLHDIGKIGIPGYILNKPGPLTYEEFNGIMKTHSTLGANIVRDVPFLRDLHKLILYHHEHYDGNGYPDGLRGEQIPLGARILHVADAFEAMTSDRPYRSSLGRVEAIRRLVEGSGKQFDPSIITAFLRIAGKKEWIGENGSNAAPSSQS